MFNLQAPAKFQLLKPKNMNSIFLACINQLWTITNIGKANNNSRINICYSDTIMMAKVWPWGHVLTRDTSISQWPYSSNPRILCCNKEKTITNELGWIVFMAPYGLHIHILPIRWQWHQMQGQGDLFTFRWIKSGTKPWAENYELCLNHKNEEIPSRKGVIVNFSYSIVPITWRVELKKQLFI